MEPLETMAEKIEILKHNMRELKNLILGYDEEHQETMERLHKLTQKITNEQGRKE